MTKADDQKAFRTAIKDGKFACAYYLYGEDDYLKYEAVRQLVASAVDPATQAFNLDQWRGGDLQGEALGVMLGTPPMMADRRVVVIRDVGALRKDARAALEQYLKAPSPDIMLVLVSAAGEKPDKHLTSVAISVEYSPLTGSQLPKWIAQYVARAGGEISDGAVSLLQEVAGSDLSLLGLELEKLLSYTGGTPITESAVTAVAGVRRDETMSHLLDAIAGRQTTTALAALGPVLQQPKSSAVTIVMALTVQMLALAWGEARGLPPAQRSREFFMLLKTTGSMYTGRAWGDAVSAWTKYASQWTSRDLDTALAALARADEALKETRLSSDEQLLSTLILTLCRAPAGRRVA